MTLREYRSPRVHVDDCNPPRFACDEYFSAVAGNRHARKRLQAIGRREDRNSGRALVDVHHEKNGLRQVVRNDRIVPVRQECSSGRAFRSDAPGARCVHGPQFIRKTDEHNCCVIAQCHTSWPRFDTGQIKFAEDFRTLR
ncbi:MAG: hypothetical protein DMG13_20210 [Acidobacteria bacterium]|nr:MAG: hypothetical protein DMG13_20210 [Acidobacteriota bacterium]